MIHPEAGLGQCSRILVFGRAHLELSSLQALEQALLVFARAAVKQVVALAEQRLVADARQVDVLRLPRRRLFAVFESGLILHVVAVGLRKSALRQRPGLGVLGVARGDLAVLEPIEQIPVLT